MKVVAVVNGKGGVGKTTTAVNLAAILAEVDMLLEQYSGRLSSLGGWRGDASELEASLQSSDSAPPKKTTSSPETRRTAKSESP